MIRDKKIKNGQLIVDLAGPEGNAFVLIGYAQEWGKSLGYSKDKIQGIISEMMSGDYEHLLQVIDREFGDYVIFER